MNISFNPARLQIHNYNTQNHNRKNNDKQQVSFGYKICTPVENMPSIIDTLFRNFSNTKVLERMRVRTLKNGKFAFFATGKETIKKLGDTKDERILTKRAKVIVNGQKALEQVCLGVAENA